MNMLILPGSSKNSSCCILDQLEFVYILNRTLRFLTDEEELTEQPSSVRQIYMLLQYMQRYSGAKKYLVSHQLCKFSHLKR